MEPAVQAMEHGPDARLVPEREPFSNEPEALINPPTQNIGPGFKPRVLLTMIKAKTTLCLRTAAI